jgi:dnd system-associated protein 4
MSERKVSRPQRYNKILDALKDSGIFNKYTNIMVFAAVLGYNRQNKKPIEKQGEPIRLGLFDGIYDEAVMNTIAILECRGDPLMLSENKTDDKIKIFEEYACGGLEILEREVFEPGLDLDQSLNSLILREFEEPLSLLENLFD